ncbi:hypothetical protein B0H65DRAFT_175154 [Neurospora tetraspora]|uniref:Methyltransferase domain-containing protein n=1 Tax=Neurospora tetraspora TaxID=94610 RepID=A0AAE0JIR5_9PEZI|nr:hypothetical protein B0H65DRAFT_175154 [Neurospora tetraspora]
MASPAENTSGTDAAITMASPALHAASPTPAAPTPITNKPLPPRPTTTTTTTATTIPNDINTKPGASVYSKPLMLTTYDKYVLGFSMTYLWRCPSSTILVPFFRENFRAEKHLDIGVGTGFFVGDALAERLAKDEYFMPLERDPDSKLVQPKIEITLMDLNGMALEKAKERVLGVVNNARVGGNGKSGNGTSGNGKSAGNGTNVAVNVTTIQADVLDESLTLPEGKLFGPGSALGTSRQFKSVSMFNLLHCLPAAPEPQGQEIKNRAFKLAAECLADDGVLSGCTILGRKYISSSSRPGSSRPGSSGTGSGSGVKKGVGRTGRPSVLSRSMTWTVMKWYNAMGVFGNWTDEREGFEKGLRENFEVVETHVVGCMLIFCAARPKRE